MSGVMVSVVFVSPFDTFPGGKHTSNFGVDFPIYLLIDESIGQFGWAAEFSLTTI